MSERNVHGYAVSASDELLSTAEAAAMIPTCNEQTLRRWARAGRVPAVVPPSGKFLFRESDIEELLVPRRLVEASAVSGEVPGQGRLSW